jgi:hypothetical protein
VKKFPACYGNWGFITTVTRARHLSAYGARSIQSIASYPTPWTSILILSHLRLGLSSGLCPSGFRIKTLYAALSPIRATCPAYLSSRCDHPNDIWWGVQIIKIFVMQSSTLPWNPIHGSLKTCQRVLSCKILSFGLFAGFSLVLLDYVSESMLRS